MTKNGARPAASCHLDYVMPDESETSRDWELRNTVTVTQSHRTTYFMAIGFGGGYSGIQEREPWMTKVAIFSLWHEGDNKVELLDQGDSVRVSGFGGEGTGLRTLMDLDWAEGEPVEFIVRGREVGGAWEVWCSLRHRGHTHFLSKYRRPGPRVDPSQFYSFLEDWDRAQGASGHLEARRAEFSSPSITFHDRGNTERVTEAYFTKVEGGLDAFASDKAIGGVVGQSFFLETGGSPGPGYMDNWTPLSLGQSNKVR